MSDSNETDVRKLVWEAEKICVKDVLKRMLSNQSRRAPFMSGMQSAACQREVGGAGSCNHDRQIGLH